MLAALAHWASEQRADGLYLQVARDDEPAARLYDGSGFSHLVGYHYRRAPAPI